MNPLFQAFAAVRIEKVIFRIVVEQRREQRHCVVVVLSPEQFFCPFQFATAGIVERGEGIQALLAIFLLCEGAWRGNSKNHRGESRTQRSSNGPPTPAAKELPAQRWHGHFLHRRTS